MPRLKLSPEAEAWRDELDRLFPKQLILTAADVGQVLGRGETQTRRWLQEHDLKWIEMTLPSGKKIRRGYTKRDLAEVLGNQMHRGWSP